MGPPVLNGAMSTLLAVICIAASPFVYFVKYFFGMYALTILVCLWNSIVVLPILLSYIVPPLPDRASGDAGKQDEGAIPQAQLELQLEKTSVGENV